MGIKISALPSIVTPALTDIFPVVQAGVTYKETVTQLSALIGTVAVTTITGTADQVIASASVGPVTLSLPQSIATTSSPTFANLTLTNPYIAGAGGLHSFQVFTTGTAATYTRPVNVSSILVEVLGGGGAGGGAVSGALDHIGTGAGGGSGGYARLLIPSAASTYTYTVGAGGTAGAAGNNPGGNGGTTTFGASLQATGGSGGDGGPAVSSAVSGISIGGAGGVGSSGTINVTGQSGFGGINSQGVGITGMGGASHYGAGGASAYGTSNGNIGGSYGSGGSGGLAVNSSQTGGAGSPGLIIIWEFA
jgi:hypothetical protein